jgi:putative ABC transport system ATP-binding protein
MKILVQYPVDDALSARYLNQAESPRHTTEFNMGSKPPLIKACGLGRKNPGGTDWLLRGAFLELRPGDRLAVVGPTGAGKTLLLRALALLDPLDEGAIEFRGKNITAHDVPAYRRESTYFHQRAPVFEGSVESNLLKPFSLKVNHGRAFQKEKVLSLLDGLGRPSSFLSQSTRDLSGGECQIVALLRAIQLDPAILLLDEPTASLDQGTTHAIEGLIDRWLAEAPSERGLVWVTHDGIQARRVSNRSLSMQAGNVVAGD